MHASERSAFAPLCVVEVKEEAALAVLAPWRQSAGPDRGANESAAPRAALIKRPRLVIVPGDRTPLDRSVSLWLRWGSGAKATKPPYI